MAAAAAPTQVSAAEKAALGNLAAAATAGLERVQQAVESGVAADIVKAANRAAAAADRLKWRARAAQAGKFFFFNKKMLKICKNVIKINKLEFYADFKFILTQFCVQSKSQKNHLNVNIFLILKNMNFLIKRKIA